MNTQTVCVSFDRDLATVQRLLRRRGAFDIDLGGLRVRCLDLDGAVQTTELDPRTWRQFEALPRLLPHISRMLMRNEPAQLRDRTHRRAHHTSNSGNSHQHDQNYYAFHISASKRKVKTTVGGFND